MWTLGSVLWLLTYKVLGASATNNINQVWAWILDEYEACDGTSQYPTMGLSWFTNPKAPRKHYPKLKGKGAQVKHIVAPVLRVWVRCRAQIEALDGGADLFLRVRTLLGHLAKIQELIDVHAQDAFMSVGNAASLRRETDYFLRLYSVLGAAADAEGLELLWNMTPKFHWLWHLADRARFLSPRRGACWIDESFVAVMKRAAKASAFGTPLHLIPKSVMSKYRWGIYCESLEWNAT
eukprot:544612-Pyramimonas_sp.AAC.1